MIQQVWDKKTTGGAPIKIWADYPDEMTAQQAMQVARLPFIHNWVALMPDAHGGYGVPVGSVVPCDGYVIPNAVGVDIGCGMCAWKTPFSVDEIDAHALMTRLVELVPTGFNNLDPMSVYLDTFRDNEVNKIVDRILELKDYKKIAKTFKGKLSMLEAAVAQCGTLGGGNHFIELQRDADGHAWIMIHSGSRGLGAKIAGYYHNVAKDTCRKYNSVLETEDLAYLPFDSTEGQNYWEAMEIGQDYARENRYAMMRAAISALAEQKSGFSWHSEDEEIVNIHHNYAAIENHYGKNVIVHRKGATQVREDVTGIIPGSMTTCSYIVRGLGCNDSFHSCSHGSGRPFSRSEAKRRVRSGLDPSQDAQLDRAGVALYGASDASDELGSAYKDIDIVINNQTDLVEIQYRLEPVAVLKG